MYYVSSLLLIHHSSAHFYEHRTGHVYRISPGPSDNFVRFWWNFQDLYKALDGNHFGDKYFGGQNKTKYLTLRTIDNSSATSDGSKMSELDFRDCTHENWLRKTNLACLGRLFHPMPESGRQQTSACCRAWPHLLWCRYKNKIGFLSEIL